MTDQTTSFPAGASAHREAAVELEDILGQLNRDGTLDPSLFEIVLSGREVTRRYRGHTRTLRLASSALRDHQRRLDVTRSALAIQGPTDVSTTDVESIARLTQEIAGMDPGNLAVGIDVVAAQVSPSALAAVLRAGLASVVGTAAVNPINATVETEEIAGGPAGYLTSDTRTVPVQAIGSALKAIADHLDTYNYEPGRRFPYAAIVPAESAEGWTTGTEAPAPAWISARGLAKILRTWPHGEQPARPAEHDILGDLIPDYELPAFARRIQEQLHEAQRELKDQHPSPSPWQAELELDIDGMENPVHQAVGAVVHSGWQEFSPSAFVRALTTAALDAAADVVRREIRHPRVTPLVVLDHAELNAEQVVEVVERYRRTVADAAADELRILGRTDSAGR